VQERPTPLIEAPALRSQIYDRLRASILSGELAPGERISPAQVAEQLGVSQMPVRDALRQLEQDGLVETSARRWTRVVELDPDLLEELLPLGSHLEQYAIRSAGTISPERLDALRRANATFAAALAAGDVAAANDADAAFHEALVALADNRSLERALRDIRMWSRLLRARVVRPEHAEESVGQHDLIIECLARGDREGAAEAVDRNWLRSARLLER
jgi:DNA-binding GntR family transcriptional regulator